MPKYEINLRDQLKCSNTIDTDMIFDLGCQLLDAFECLHEAGYVYNDLKPENIMINKIKDNSMSLTKKYVLIDFGMARKFYDPSKNKNENSGQ